MTSAVDMSYNTTCEVCHGKGAVPTGEFTLEDNPSFPIISDINEISNPEEREMMMRRALKH